MYFTELCLFLQHLSECFRAKYILVRRLRYNVWIEAVSFIGTGTVSKKTKTYFFRDMFCLYHFWAKIHGVNVICKVSQNFKTESLNGAKCCLLLHIQNKVIGSRINHSPDCTIRGYTSFSILSKVKRRRFKLYRCRTSFQQIEISVSSSSFKKWIFQIIQHSSLVKWILLTVNKYARFTDTMLK